MNMMYVVVSERTPEIGLRKAVGAKYDDIMLHLLVESVLITMISGFVGVGIGVFISWVISYTAGAYGYEWNFHIPVVAFVVALTFSVIFGMVFGYFPARKAALLKPIEAMRHE